METMKADKSKQPPARPIHALVAELAAMDGIPVYELTFTGKPDLPIPESQGGMGRIRAREDRTITYLPKMLIYRVVQTFKDRGPKTFYIPRELAIFEPLENQKP